MKLHFLGTGAGIPSRQRNVSALALQFDRNAMWWLFDCGEATQHKLLQSPLKLSRLTHLFVSHLHGDHIYGIPGLLGSRSFQAPDIPLTITGPRGLKTYIDTTLAASQTHLTYPLTVCELDAETPTLHVNGFTITVRWLQHVIPSLGFRIEEPQQPGRLKTDVLAQLGLPPGPLYAKLKQGEDVHTDTGQLVRSVVVVGPPRRGRVVTILGDTAPCSAAVDLAAHADMLVHEATFASDEAAKAHQYGHSTSVDAARTAQSAGAQRLCLTHISSRYQETGTRILLEEATAIFPDTLVVNDGDVVEVL